MKKNWKLGLVVMVGAVALAALWYQFSGQYTAAGQPPLAELNQGSLDQLRADFNAAVDETRMIVLLSPT